MGYTKSPLQKQAWICQAKIDSDHVLRCGVFFLGPDPAPHPKKYIWHESEGQGGAKVAGILQDANFSDFRLGVVRTAAGSV